MFRQSLRHSSSPVTSSSTHLVGRRLVLASGVHPLRNHQDLSSLATPTSTSLVSPHQSNLSQIRNSSSQVTLYPPQQRNSHWLPGKSLEDALGTSESSSSPDKKAESLEEPTAEDKDIVTSVTDSQDKANHETDTTSTTETKEDIKSQLKLKGGTLTRRERRVLEAATDIKSKVPDLKSDSISLDDLQSTLRALKRKKKELLREHQLRLAQEKEAALKTKRQAAQEKKKQKEEGKEEKASKEDTVETDKTVTKPTGKKAKKAASAQKKSDASSETLHGAAQVIKNVLESQKKPRDESYNGEAATSETATLGEDISTTTGNAGPETSTEKPTKKSKKEKKAAAAPKKKESERKAKSSSKKKKDKEKMEVQTINTADLHFSQITQADDVPRLAHGLDRVLFNPGVHQMQDFRSRVYNFNPKLSKIMPVNEFDFGALKAYVTSSKDTTLLQRALESHKLYSGSTSSMSSTLAHFHYLLSAWRPVNPMNTSSQFRPDNLNYTAILRAPAASFLHWKEGGVYAMDADKEFDSANVLSMLGKSMEKMFLLPSDEYERYHRSKSAQISEEERNAEEAFSFATMGDFMIRSQLDAQDPRLPGVGNFDLKTRAVVSIRMDAANIKKGLGYEIRKRYGEWESFEREYFDMIRSAFLKYSLQVRMGLMDGIFVAYHNTQRIFGFQYISLPEMDEAIHGTNNTDVGDGEFRLSLKLLNELFNKATAKYPDQSLRIHVEARPTNPPLLYFFAKPVTQDEIDAVQNANRESVEKFEREMMGLDEEVDPETENNSTLTSPDGTVSTVESGPQGTSDSAAASAEVDGEPSTSVPDWSSQKVWQQMQMKVEHAVESDELGVGYVQEAIETALRQSGLLQDKTPEEAQLYINKLVRTLTNETEDLEDDVDVEAATSMEGDVEAEAPSEATSSEMEEAGSTEGEAEAVSESEPVEPVSSEPSYESSDVGLHTPDDTYYVPESGVATEDLESTSLEESQNESSSVDGETPATEIVEEHQHASLKDLVLRLAEQVDERSGTTPVSDETDGSVCEKEKASGEMAKLREFERILSELMADRDEEEVVVEEVEEEEEGEEEVEEEKVDVEASKSSESASSESSSTPATLVESVATAATKKSQTSAAKLAKQKKKAEEAVEDQDGSLLGLILTVRNKVDGQYVERPPPTTKTGTWNVEYSIQEMPTERAHRIYNQLKGRRQKSLETRDRDSEWYKMFGNGLHFYSQQGRAHREKEDALAREQPVHVVGQKDPLSWEEVFGSQD